MAVELTAAAREQTRARYPDESGFVERDGVRIFYEVYGDGRADGPAAADVVDHPLAPLEDADPVPRAPLPRRHLRRARQRPLRPAAEPARTTSAEFAADALAVLDATGDGARRRSSSLSLGAQRALLLAAEHPERVDGLVFIGPALPLAAACRAARRARLRRASSTPTRAGRSTTATTGSRDYRGFLEFFFSQMFTEPHSTKQIEDCVGWGLETTPRRSSRRRSRRGSADEAAVRDALRARATARCS